MVSESHCDGWWGWNIKMRTYQRNICLPQQGGRFHITVGKNGVFPTRLGISSPSTQASQVALEVKNLSFNAGDMIHESGRSPERGHGNPFQNSCLENPMDKGACWAIVHGVAKSWTWLKRLSRHEHTASTQFIAWDTSDPIEDWPFSLKLKDSVPSRLSWSHAELEKTTNSMG